MSFQKSLVTYLLLINILISYGQNNDGYWDKKRATKMEYNLSAGSKTWMRTDALPIWLSKF